LRLASRPIITVGMTTFFTADNHFGHANIIVMSARPFSSVEEMDETMIANWNAVVSRGDNVWHVGDFAHRIDAKRKRGIFGRLNGSKHLVPGSRPFGELARQIVDTLPSNPERSTALRKLLGVKDCSVRALLFKTLSIGLRHGAGYDEMLEEAADAARGRGEIV
jgi:hypothetical protein